MDVTKLFDPNGITELPNWIIFLLLGGLGFFGNWLERRNGKRVGNDTSGQPVSSNGGSQRGCISVETCRECKDIRKDAEAEMKQRFDAHEIENRAEVRRLHDKIDMWAYGKKMPGGGG